jgi:hypothetical protein
MKLASRHPRTRVVRPVGVCLALVLAACGDDGADGDGELAAEQVASAIDSGSELARLVVPFEATPDLGGLTRVLAIARKVEDAIAKLHMFVANDSCLTVATDHPTFVEAAFAECRFAAVLRLDGSIRADVDVETSGAAIPIKLLVNVVSPGLTVTGPVRSRHLAGRFVLRHPITPGTMPVELEGRIDFDNDAGDMLSLSTTSEWTVAASCVTLTGGGEITGAALGSLGPIATSTRGVHVCRSACPDAGMVELSHGRGALLQWTYTGDDTAIVVGPRGTQLEVPLSCGGE